MKFERALEHLREGKRIYRHPRSDNYLQAELDEFDKILHVYGSYYMTIYDVLAEDWTVDWDLFNNSESLKRE